MTAIPAVAPVSLPSLHPASFGPAHAPAGVPQPGFGQLLEELAAATIGNLKAGETAAIAGIEGRIPVQDVVSAVMGAERSFQTALAIRDKVVSAWLEMTRMQI